MSGIRTESAEIGQAVIGCAYPAAFYSAGAPIHYAGFDARESRAD